MGMNEQCKIISFINDEAFVSDSTNWKKGTNKFPADIFRFCRRYLILQTELHVFNNCKKAIDLDTWRHDTILFIITEHLKPKLANSFRIYVESLHLGFPSPKGLFSGKIPDIVLQQRNHMNRTHMPRRNKLVNTSHLVNTNLIVIENLRIYLLFLVTT